MRKRNRNVSFRVTAIEHEKLMHKVDASGLTLSEFAIATMVNGKTAILNTAGLMCLAVEVRKVGININQLAKKANSGDVIVADEINSIKKEYEQTWQLLRRSLLELH